jgi:squalene-hopene/tetraprenyl-beta-curcumene cyclase
MPRIGFVLALLVITSATLAATRLRADDAASGGVDAKLYQQTVERGIDFLIHKGQQADGSYGKDAGPGVTALCTTALLKHGRSPDDPAVSKSLKYLESFVHDDGGIYSPGSPIQNYETCLCVQCFAAANADGRYKNTLAKADQYIKNLQLSGEPSDFSYGGSGYGPKMKRPDLSNTGFLLEALQATGAGADDEAVKRALVFVSRCQNLESEHNTTPFAAKNPDGGFYYTPASGGGSDAGKTPEGGLRSYGSMTYTGLKSMIFAGVKADDPRVKAAVGWIKKHYTLSSNPGMLKTRTTAPEDGLYYYYQTFAKALSALGVETLDDDQGVKHAWKQDLLVALSKSQRPDGSWVNADPKFLEGNANLVTGFALLALSYAKPAN